LVKLKDQERFPGKSVVTVDYDTGCPTILNPQNPIVEKENPVQVAKLGASQDRIFQIIEAEGKVVMCSTPVTTALGGAVSIYDPATGKLDVYRNVSKDQSITSALYQDGKLYLGTHVWGGLSMTPTTTTAKIIVFDMETRKVVNEMTPVIEDYKSPILNTGDLVFGDDGLIWSATGGAIFAFDKDTLEIKKSKVINPSTPQSTGTQIFFGMPLDKIKNGLFIGKFATGIYVFDPDTLESKKISETAYRLTVAEDGNIYSTDYRNFIKIPVYYNGETVVNENEVKDKLGKSMALLLGKSTGLVNGEAKQIDPDNTTVVAKEMNGRTLVPLRFVAESLGAEMVLDKATNTATVKKDGKTIKAVLGKSEIIVNGVAKKIDTQVIEEKGRILLPLRAISEALGKTIFWDDRGIILITTVQCIVKTIKNF